MTDCLHLKLSKLADTVYEPFETFKAGFRFYRCESCGQTLAAKESYIRPKDDPEVINA